MPTYEFRCDTCGEKSTHICRVAEKPDSLPCPHECDGRQQAILSPTMTTFKFADRRAVKK